MSRLARAIDEQRSEIERKLVIGKARWETLVAKVAKQEVDLRADFYDEQVWTFLVATAHAAAGDEGVAALAGALTERQATWRPGHRIWFEVLPVPPRVREGNTNVDLAVGDLRIRPSVDGGVELDPEVDAPWACLAEAKWYSDISTKTTHSPERNQLARVAENAACLQAEGRIVSEPHVTLITPRRFRDTPVRSRLYAYKFEEYREDTSTLLREWQAVGSAMPPREERRWAYPDNVEAQAQRLRFHWTTYEDLLSAESVPGSPIRTALVAAAKSWNGT